MVSLDIQCDPEHTVELSGPIPVEILFVHPVQPVIVGNQLRQEASSQTLPDVSCYASWSGQRRLEGLGRLQAWVVGSFPEASKDVHGLIDCLADSKLRARGLARERESDEWERSIIHIVPVALL